MKFIITESKIKDLIFKFFDKRGGKIDHEFMVFFDINTDFRKNLLQAYDYLIEWRGVDRTKELVKELLLDNPHHVVNGPYNLFFDVYDISNITRKNESWGMWVHIKIDDFNSTAQVHTDNNPSKLREVLKNDLYRHEIGIEVDWLISEYLDEFITPKTGVIVQHYKPDYIGEN